MKNDQDDYYTKKMADSSEMAEYFAYAVVGFLGFALLVGLYEFLFG